MSSCSSSSTVAKPPLASQSSLNETFFDADALLIPKQETAASAFVATTGYSGRHCLIGILDTGIDPATNRYMRDGVTPKLINVVDCTGSGNVDVAHERQGHLVVPTTATTAAATSDRDGTPQPPQPLPNSYWQVTGLTGRTLKLPTAWKIQPFPTATATTLTATATATTTMNDDTLSATKSNQINEGAPTTDAPSPLLPSSSAVAEAVTVRLGVKRAYELFPQALTQRIQEERQRMYDLAVAPHIATVREQLSAWQATYSAAAAVAGETTTSKPEPWQIKQRDNLQALLDILTTPPEEDPGPVYDCVVYWDGRQYRAAVDVHETGDFVVVGSNMPLAAFGVERQYGSFGVSEQLNYAVQFYLQGRLLSLVTDCSPHGTHVATIAAGATAGVAPDAQLVSFKIGEPRLGTMETGLALARALKMAVQLKCDVINLSYGEAVQVADRGRFVEQAEECVWKHNVVFVAAAGNQGPALTTVNAPGGTTSACIGVAALVSPAMRHPLYSCLPPEPAIEQEEESMRNNSSPLLFPETITYTWSSTGPTVDGDVGISVTAPGGAIATVPHWCLQKSRLMNGTSMASPHVTGCVALLISACKAEKITVSQARIRRALENTAQCLPNVSPLQQGWGMVQVDAAWEYLKAHCYEETEDIYFSVQIASPNGKVRGIYLRQPHETAVRKTFTVTVNPQFQREDRVSEVMQRRKIDLELHFTLESTESWVIASSHFMLMNDGRSFEIEVDPTGLKSGVHTAKVCGIQVDKPDRKVLFSIPITVIKPHLPAQRSLDLGVLDFEPAEVKRFFVVPPPGSTWMDVTLRDTRDAATDGDASYRLIALHTVQLLPHAAFRENECNKRLTLMPGQTLISSISVEPGVTCELTLARYWSTRGATNLTATVQFQGIRPVPNDVNFGAGSGGAMVRIYGDLETESVHPVAKLTKWQTPIRPKANCVITPLKDERDALPSSDKKTYELILTYEFEQEDKGSFLPRAPALQGVLYESGFESQCMLIFDGEKKYLGIVDAYPSSVNAPKGPVVIRLQIRHDDPSKLETLKDLVIWIERNLSKEIPLAAYSTREKLMLAKDTFQKRTLQKGCSAAVFFAEPAHSKLPSGCSVGHRLVGVVSYEAGESTLPGDGKKPGGFPIS